MNIKNFYRGINNGAKPSYELFDGRINSNDPNSISQNTRDNSAHIDQFNQVCFAVPLILALNYLLKKLALNNQKANKCEYRSQTIKRGKLANIAIPRNKLSEIFQEFIKGSAQLLPIYIILGHLSKKTNLQNLANPSIVAHKVLAGQVIGPRSASIAENISVKKSHCITPVLSTALTAAYLYLVKCKDIKSRVPAIAFTKFINHKLTQCDISNRLPKNQINFISAASGVILHILGEVAQGKNIGTAAIIRLSEEAMTIGIGEISNQRTKLIPKNIGTCGPFNGL